MRWKAVERRVAAKVGGHRRAVDGTRGSVDVDHPLFAYQIKSRRSLPAWLWHWLGPIVARADPHRIGVLVLHRPGERLDDAVVLLRFRDWVALHGRLTPTTTSSQEAHHDPPR